MQESRRNLSEHPAGRMQVAQARTTEVWIGLMHCIPGRADVLGFRYKESKGRRSDIGELLEVGVRSCTHPEQDPRNNSQLREKRWIGLRLDKLGEESLITRPCKIARPPTSNHNGPRSSHPLGSPDSRTKPHSPGGGHRAPFRPRGTRYITWALACPTASGSANRPSSCKLQPATGQAHEALRLGR